MTNILQTNYTGGELSPGLYGRTDVDKYYNGCARLENMVVLDQGGVTRRGGTRFRAALKYPGRRVRLVEFIYSTVQAYLLEVGHYYIRFYKDGGQIQAPGGGPYEVATPFAEAHLEDLTFSQSTDTLFISHHLWMRRLVRLDHNDWRLQNIKIERPALARDEWLPPATLTPGAVTGSRVSFTTSSPIFLTGDIGCEVKARNGAGRAVIVDPDNRPAATLTPGAVSGAGVRFRASAAVFGVGDVNAKIEVIGAEGEAVIKTLIREYAPDGTLTPAATTGEDIAFTTSESFLTAAHVGCEFEAVNGVGRARITAVVSGTEATCDILTNFANTDPIAEGDWLLLGHYTTGLLPAGAPAATLSHNVLADISEAFASTSPIASGSWRLVGGRIAGTSVTCDIIDDFDSVTPLAAGQWVLTGGLRQGEISYRSTLYDANVVTGSTAMLQQYYTPGTVITLDAQVDIFRAGDVGKYARILGGCIEFSKYLNPRKIQAVIRRDLPSTQSSFLHFGEIVVESPAWSAARGWPWNLVFHKNRLIAAGSNSQPETIWGSKSGGFYDFLPGGLDGDPFEFTLAGDQVNAVQWLKSAKKLFMGTPNGEFIYPSNDQPMGPNNPSLAEETSIGSRRLRAVKRDNMIFFTAADSNRLHALLFNLETNGFAAKDLNILADHLVKEGQITGLAATKGPQAIIWAVRDDGVLLGLSFQQEHNVWGWHRHTTVNGVVEQVACIPGDGAYETWLAVRRTIEGRTVRYLETVENYDYQSLEAPDAFFVDCGLSYEGVPATVITGLEHLEGQEVAILADGAVQPRQTVADGQITLSWAAGKVHVGLPMTSYLQHVPLAAPGAGNSLNMLEKGVSQVVLRLYRSLGCKLGPDAAHLETVAFRQANQPMDAPPPLYSGIKAVNYRQGWERQIQPLVVQEQPLPLTVLGAVIKFEVADPD